MATEKWIAGTQAVYATAVTTALPALTSGQAWYSDLVIGNGSSLDMFATVSIHLGTFNCVAPNYIGVYVLPLNYGGLLYGDGRTVASAFTGPPPSQYWVANIIVDVSSAVQDGSTPPFPIPPRDFVFGFHNAQATTLNATNVVQYRTLNRSVS